MTIERRQLVPRIEARVTEAALDQQLTYWRERARKQPVAAQLVALLAELKALRGANGAEDYVEDDVLYCGRCHSYIKKTEGEEG